jgi:hypothetical protein
MSPCQYVRTASITFIVFIQNLGFESCDEEMEYLSTTLLLVVQSALHFANSLFFILKVTKFSKACKSTKLNLPVG